MALSMATGLEPCKIALRKPRCRSRTFIKTAILLSLTTVCAFRFSVFLLAVLFPSQIDHVLPTNAQSKAQSLDSPFPAAPVFERMQHHDSVRQAEIRHSVLAQSGDKTKKSRAEIPFYRIGSTRNQIKISGAGLPDNKLHSAYHSKRIFLQDYKQMVKKFKIFVYPHCKDHPFWHIFSPLDRSPTGNYASESYFKKALMNSSFVTKDPARANLFYLPFSIARLRHDQRVGVTGIPGFLKGYMANITQQWPYWNRTRGKDHFYVSCHSISKVAMDQAEYVRTNAIQVVCSSTYYSSAFIPHKDISIPQIWPREGTPAQAGSIVQRKTLAFFAGGANSEVREKLVKTWANDSEILVYSHRIETPYSEAFVNSKFCLHVKGYEVNTARIADAMHFGCVPVIIANHYDLPFVDVLNWKTFSIVVATLDIPKLKHILKAIGKTEYAQMHRRVMEVRQHFQWHSPPQSFDAFYMVMYQLWLKRHVLSYPLPSSSL